MADGRVAYAVLPGGTAPPPDLVGLEGAPIRSVDAAGLALWVSGLAAPPSPGPAAAGIHHRVVAAALATGVTPLPLRFGQWLPGEEQARALLVERAAAWRADLARLAGLVEVGVRAVASGGARPARSMHGRPRSGGAAYLRAVAREHADARAAAERARALARRLEAGTVPRVRERKVEILPEPPATLSAAYLVDRTEAEPVKEALARVAREHAAPGFAVTGPWPPYSFA